ncbi:hypothetical protein STRIC_1254 [Streptococcus ictaluri 707-05]|uniref:Efflux ABC transporter, permease protein n=1 Tax=Streptococcus ictaluri 707-05 TaxID=764299 RepID=G5K386_9STRE|nr:hypothetical protein STRIC_1254 [Streptococcus ictaluri 707-05]
MQLSPLAFLITALIFITIFILLGIIGLFKIRKTSPLMLFRDKEQGEKEPRGNTLLAILSLFAIGTGYYLSLTSSNLTALAVLGRFFIAVIIVIIGTYLFYIAFMTWYLKKRRQNKTYFYQPEHFVSTSQMIFRMKQNAVGLANITILAVMAFVAIATTTALYNDTESMTKQLFPKSSHIEFVNSDIKDQREVFDRLVLAKNGKAASDFTIFTSAMVSFDISTKETITVTKESISSPSPAKTGFVYLITQDDFRGLGNHLPRLKAKETAFFKQTGDSHLKELTLLGETYHNVKNFKSVNFPPVANTYNPAILVVPDTATLHHIQKQFYDITQFGNNPTLSAYANLSQKEIDSITDGKGVIKDGESYIGHIETKEDFLKESYALTGGFLFTGFLLGLSFILGAALIIYYKQYSEGHEDKKSYRILQEVGMSQKDH